MKGRLPEGAGSARRGKAFRVTVVGAFLLLIAVLLAGGTVAAARDADAYKVARPCVLPAAWSADCVQQVPGTVSGVVDTSGKGAQHKLEVSTAEGDHWVEFPSGNTIVASVLDGAPVTLTVWRSHVVSVTWLGTEVATNATPEWHVHRILAGTLFVFGAALFMLPMAGFAGIQDRGRRTSAKVTFASFGTFLSSLPMLAGALASLGGMSPGTDVATIAVFLVPMLACAGWLTSRSLARQRLRTRSNDRPRKGARGAAVGRSAHRGATPPAPAPALAPAAAPALPPRPRAGRRKPKVGMADVWSYAFIFLGIGAAATFIMMVAECVPGRAHDHAPFCANGVVASSCRADTSLRVIGTRSNGADLTVFFDGPDGSSPSATFDSGTAVRSTAASGSETSDPVPVELWHGEVWQAEFDGRWYLAGDRPVYEVGATAAFAVVSGVLLLIVRFLVHRRAKGWYLGRRQRLQDGAGQALLLAAGIWWLETGAWWGALLVVADAVWAIRSILRSVPVTGLPSVGKMGPQKTGTPAPNTALTARRDGKGKA